MSKWSTAEELANMESKLRQETDVHKLHKKAFRIAKMYLKARDEATSNGAVVDALRKQLSEAFDAVENVETRKDMVHDMLKLTFNNYKDLAQTLKTVTQKEDNTPLNNEMAQVKQILHNSSEKHYKDVEELKIKHAQIASKLNDERSTRNNTLESENYGLKIKLHRQESGKDATMSSYCDLMELILNLAQKSNGEPLNNEMAQIVRAVKESKKTHSMKMTHVECDYLERLSEMYDWSKNNSTKKLK